MDPAQLLSPSEFARETGQDKDLLRKWRQRYGFPELHTAASGARGYTREQVAELRLILRLQDAGLPPARTIGRPLDELERCCALLAPDTPSDTPIAQIVHLLRGPNPEHIDDWLAAELGGRGLTRFVTEVAAPLTAALGQAWSIGDVDVHHEHLFSAMLARCLDRAAARHQPAAGAPRVLLATLSGEQHTLGLHMLRALLTEHGAICLDLGASAPAGEIAASARSVRADVVALSFSTAYPRRRVLPDLRHLRAELAPDVALWAGGAGARPLSRPPPGVALFDDLLAAVAAYETLRDRSRAPAPARAAEGAE